MQLGGTPPQLYDQARDGVADLVWTLPGNTPGRFPISEIFELPFTRPPQGMVNARALQDFADQQLRRTSSRRSTRSASGRMTRG